jgi:NAD(P)-dependent dehydrogenase (short-subunit alcohol dehydrogenase family)
MLIDQRIVVIGGSAGIGFAVANAAEDAGADVLIASSSQTKLDKALGQFSEKVRGAIVDVTNEESVRKLFEDLGEVDHVAVTVGTSYKSAPVADSEISESQKPFLVKYWGQFLVAKYAGPRLSKRGSLTLTSGVLSQRPSKSLAAQASVNAAVEALARTLALELAPRRVNVVSPGFIDTGKLLRDLPPHERAAKLAESKGAGLPSQRVGQAEDAASAFLFAIQNPYLSGQVLFVDGARLLSDKW